MPSAQDQRGSLDVAAGSADRQPTIGDIRLTTDGIWYRIERYRMIGFLRWRRTAWVPDEGKWVNETEANFHYSRERRTLERQRDGWRVVA